MSAEAAEDATQAVMKAVIVMNPLEKFFGGSSVGDYFDRNAKLAHTITKITEALGEKETYKELITKTLDISTKLNSNSRFLENVRVLITGHSKGTAYFETRKGQFLAQYQSYTPRVSKDELTEMATMWENLIDRTCNLMLGPETNLAAVPLVEVRASGLCPNTEAQAQKLFATIEEIHDFQFELIETMATSMRALTAVDASLSIVSNYDTLPSEVDRVQVKVLSLLSYILYKTNVQGTTED